MSGTGPPARRVRSVRGERPRVITTRDEPGALEQLLVEAGIEVVHVPLIRIVDVAPDRCDRASALDEALAALDEFAWLVVTSRHGARRAGPAAAAVPSLRLACVGTRTAQELAQLAGRAVDVVPMRQTGADLVAAMPPGTGRVLLAQADRAGTAVAEGLTGLGYAVTAVTAYRTELRTPTRLEREAMLDADAVAFASGSAVRAWVAAVGTHAPRRVVAIGPATAEAARRSGLQVTHVAADHSVKGLAAEVVCALATDS